MSFNPGTARVRSWAAACLVACLFASAAGVAADERRPQPPLPSVTLDIRTAGGETAAIRVELARTAEQHKRGLMFRKTLAEDRGMLFIFERDERLSFWMKNTTVPLSIAFIDRNGLIIDIANMEPRSVIPVRSSRSARYALEAPRGWFARRGVAEGDRVMLGTLQAAP